MILAITCVIYILRTHATDIFGDIQLPFYGMIVVQIYSKGFQRQGCINVIASQCNDISRLVGGQQKAIGGKSLRIRLNNIVSDISDQNQALALNTFNGRAKIGIGIVEYGNRNVVCGLYIVYKPLYVGIPLIGFAGVYDCIFVKVFSQMLQIIDRLGLSLRRGLSRVRQRLSCAAASP